jgi:exosortase
MDRRVDASQLVETWRLNGTTRVLVLLLVLIPLGVILYGSTLSSVILSVLDRENASHGVCVPFISGYLVWLKWEMIKRVRPHFAPVPGMVIMGAGLLLLLFLGDETGVFLPALSFVLVAAGLIMGLFGKEAFKELRFPFFFLVAMIPLPGPLYAQLTQGMRLATTSLSVGALQLLHFPVHREGFNVFLPNMMLFIANSCSGIRYLIPYFVFGLAYAFVCKKTLGSRILTVLATIPLSILAGGLRQSFIFLSGHYIGPFMTGHQPHVLISWSVFMTVLLTSMWMDRRVSISVRRQKG